MHNNPLHSSSTSLPPQRSPLPGRITLRFRDGRIAHYPTSLIGLIEESPNGWVRLYGTCGTVTSITLHGASIGPLVDELVTEGGGVIHEATRRPVGTPAPTVDRIEIEMGS